MGREFLDVFTGWAEDYDAFVEGKDKEYRAVFARYDEILNEIVVRSGPTVLEFGIGTGNLTQKLLNAGREVFAVEPSFEMRKQAAEKLQPQVTVHDGDMQTYPKPDKAIDTVVSSYVFHHLTDKEKASALREYYTLLAPGGKIVFADTVFVSQEDFQFIIETAKENDYHDLVEDLHREYYPLLPTIYHALKDAGFQCITFKQMNDFVWVFEGTKI